MCLYFALMYKTLGEYRWTDLFKSNATSTNVTIFNERTMPIVEEIFNKDTTNEQFINSDETIFTSAKNLQSTLQELKGVSLIVTRIY